MKLKILFCSFFLFMSVCANAQESSYSYLLDNAMECLKNGECDKARKYYNAYVNLTGETKPSVKELIDICEKPKEKYAVGEKMQVGEDVYTVAYVRDEGKHGLAVLDKGYGSIAGEMKNFYIEQKNIPTLEELGQIYANRDIIRFYGVYWTCTENSRASCTAYYTKDFSTGRKDSECKDYKHAIILLIHRF